MDKWTLSNKGIVPENEDFAYWVSMALKRALSPTNITRGFLATGIFPLNPRALDGKMDPNSIYSEAQPSHRLSSTNEEEIEELELREVQGIFQ